MMSSMDSQVTPPDKPVGHDLSAVEVWEPFPGLRLRATDLGEAGFGVEVWQRAPGGVWAYRALRPDDLAAGR